MTSEYQLLINLATKSQQGIRLSVATMNIVEQVLFVKGGKTLT